MFHALRTELFCECMLTVNWVSNKLEWGQGKFGAPDWTIPYIEEFIGK